MKEMDEETATLLAVCAPWSHIRERLQEHDALEAHIRSTVVLVEGMQDEVIIGCITRHVCSTFLDSVCAWLQRSLFAPRS